MSQTVLDPILNPSDVGARRWMVVIYNNETNSFDEVIDALIGATGCDVDEAHIEAWEAHTYGKAPVHFASREACESAAGSIAGIGVKTEVCLEWPED